MDLPPVDIIFPNFFCEGKRYCQGGIGQMEFDFGQLQRQKMSAQQLPCIQKLRQEQDHESFKSREQYRQSGGEKSKEKLTEKREGDQEEVMTEVKVVIDQEKILCQRASIFASKKENEARSNIFANCKSVNLFNMPKSTRQDGAINIFTLASSSQPVLPNDPEDDLLSHSSQGQEPDPNEQLLPEPAQKVMNYQYEEQTRKIAEFRLTRFKNNGLPTKEGVLLSLEQEKNSSRGLLLLLVRSEVTKVVIYQAWLLPGTKVETFMNKPENLKMTAVSSKKTSEGIKHERDTIKLQFENVEGAETFRKTLEDLEKEVKEQTKKDEVKEVARNEDEVKEKMEIVEAKEESKE